MPPVFSLSDLPQLNGKPFETSWLSCLISNWELARSAYEAMLCGEREWSDQALSRCQNYNQLLSAGLALSRLCGPDALHQFADALATSCPRGKRAHFGRLWRGLLTERPRDQKLHA